MRLLRIGHRGAAGTHPENTMVSFRRALELGAQGIEFDVHRTQDGHLVVIHDLWLHRTTNGQGLVRDHTLAEIQALDAGAWKGSEFAGERVPTLREVIRGTPAQCRLFLELKFGSIHYPGIEGEVLALLREEGALPRTQISSFDHHALKRIHELDPGVEIGMLFDCNLLDPVASARACGARALHPAGFWVTPDLIRQARAAGLAVTVWTVNEPPFIALMKHLGVDGIMSDYPDRI